MKGVRYLLFGTLFLLVLSFALAAISSESYIISRGTVTEGGGNSMSAGNDSTVILGSISGAPTSSSYISQIGVLYGLSAFPIISWISPTPADLAEHAYRWVFLNTTIASDVNTSAFFDWNGSLVGYWNFENTNSTGVFDNSSYGNFGTFQNGLGESNLTTGRFGQALNYDGSNDYLSVTSTSELNEVMGSTTTFTISAWLKPDAWTDYGAIAKAPGGCWSHTTNGLWVYSGGFRCVMGDANTSLCNPAGSYVRTGVYKPSLNNWYHVACVGDGTNMKMYVDGVERGSVAISGLTTNRLNTTQAVTIGRRQASNGGALSGGVDEVSLFNRALSLQEVKVIYDNSQYRLYNNFTSLPNGIYNYSAYAIDEDGLLTKSSRSVNVTGNSPPTISLISPTDDSVLTDRTPDFVFDGVDAEGDTLVYDINISKEGLSLCTDYNLDVEDHSSETYTPSVDLKCLSDNNDYYEWSVRACENETVELFCSDWSSVWTVNISSSVSITLPVDSSNFGSMSILETKNTTTDTPNPITMENDGNSRINVSLNASAIWDSALASGTSDYFNASMRSYSGKASWAETDWFNVPLTGNTVIVSDLNYSDASDDLDFDILLSVPADEVSGAKSSEIIFRAALSEVYDAA